MTATATPLPAAVRPIRPAGRPPRRRYRRYPRVLAWFLPLLGLAWTGSLHAGPPDLTQLRAERRAAMRTAARADSLPLPFALLVIPVDFADARLPGDWEAQAALGGRLFPPQGETLAGYYRIASRGRLDLGILLAPLVHLAGTRREYSDRDLGGGYTRTRRLARESLEGALADGLDFRLLDDDGPDRRAGSGDDDGQVDGVLILHAGIGEENDPVGGLVQALQFYLDEPVVDRGVVAGVYAVASMRSGLGIWAHEVGHLLGLEDRYDRRLASTGGDVLSRGGLGIFSLMAAGAWGNGNGAGAALLDAYSMAELGWCEIVPQRGAAPGLPDTLRPTSETGRAWRVWTHGRSGPEYFLLETRGGPAAGPFDAAVPPDELLVYHVDEEVPEAVTWPAPHLRVALLEADGDGSLADGLDRGGPQDLFPGSLGVTALTPATQPSSGGYDGPTEISLTAITSLADGVSLGVQDAVDFAVSVRLGFGAGAPPRLWLDVQETGPPLTGLTGVIEAVGSPSWGRFEDGELQASLLFERDASGLWTVLDPPAWIDDPPLPAGASTRFRIQLAAQDWSGVEVFRSWVWRDDDLALDFAGSWPGTWEILYPGGVTSTTWQRWAGAPYLTGDGSPVLICTGSLYTQPSDWPIAEYENRADVVLRSAPLPRDMTAVRLVHAMDGELVRPGVAWDAGLVEFEGGDGSIRPAAPVDGYDGIVDPASQASLHGRPAFVGTDSLTAAGPWRWRLDLIPVPDLPPPVRLRLHFASDPQFGGRGWVVAGLQAALLPDRSSAFPVAILPGSGGEPARLVWDGPGLPVAGYRVEASRDQGISWLEIWSGAPGAGAGGYAHGLRLENLPADLSVPASERLVLRVVADAGVGEVASRGLAWYRDGGAESPQLLAAPYPNPALGEVRILVQLPALGTGRLGVYDLRGRCLRTWMLSGGSRLLRWDGRDGRGRPAASGLYFFRLACEGREAVRSVVLLR